MSNIGIGTKVPFPKHIFFWFLDFWEPGNAPFFPYSCDFCGYELKRFCPFFLWITIELQTPDSIGILRKNQEKNFGPQNLKIYWENWVGKILVKTIFSFSRIFSIEFFWGRDIKSLSTGPDKTRDRGYFS